MLGLLGVWFAALKLEAITEWGMWLFWAGVAFAAFVTARTAPSRKFLMGTLFALPSAVMLGGANLVFESLGNAVDFPGWGGAALLAAITLPFHLLLCALGGGIAILAKAVHDRGAATT